MSYVDKLPNGCWFWTGGRSRGKGNRKWYGTFWFRGKSIRAHRFSCDYIGKFEPLPPGKHRDHTCVFSMCVNPEHLEHVTHEENQDRKLARLTAQKSWDGHLLTFGYGIESDEATRRMVAYEGGMSWEEYKALYGVIERTVAPTFYQQLLAEAGHYRMSADGEQVLQVPPSEVNSRLTI